MVNFRPVNAKQTTSVNAKQENSCLVLERHKIQSLL